jgi:hypothetical protein
MLHQLIQLRESAPLALLISKVCLHRVTAYGATRHSMKRLRHTASKAHASQLATCASRATHYFALHSLFSGCRTCLG